MGDEQPGTKKLFYNGNFICEYESTGDEQRDLELASDLLDARGFKSDEKPANSLFRQALAFSTTASYLF